MRPPLQICNQCQRYRWQIATIISDTSSKPEVENLVALSLWTFFCMYKIVQSENRRFTLSFFANWKLYPIAKSTVHKCPPLPPHTNTHKWLFFKYIKIVGGSFTCNTAELFSFGPSPTRAKKAWSSYTCLLYAGIPAIAGTSTKARMLTTAGTPGMVETWSTGGGNNSRGASNSRDNNTSADASNSSRDCAVEDTRRPPRATDLLRGCSLVKVIVRWEENHQYYSPIGMKVTAGMPATSGPSATTGMIAIAGMPATAGTPTKARMLTIAGMPEMV